MHAMINIALRAARSAAENIAHASDRLDRLKLFDEDPDNFSSSMDQEADNTLLYQLQKIQPGACIKSRLSGTTGDESAETHWLIDPLLGSKNFFQGLPHYAVSLACVQNQQVQHAVVLFPLTNEEFTCTRGNGAQINARRLRVGKKTEPAGSIFGLHAHCGEEDILLAMHRALLNHEAQVRLSGSAEIDMLYTAADRLQGGWCTAVQGPASIAARLILQEAGGLVANEQGNPDLTDAREILYGNPAMFKQLLKLRRECHTG